MLLYQRRSLEFQSIIWNQIAMFRKLKNDFNLKQYLKSVWGQSVKTKKKKKKLRKGQQSSFLLYRTCNKKSSQDKEAFDFRFNFSNKIIFFYQSIKISMQLLHISKNSSYNALKKNFSYEKNKFLNPIQFLS